MPARCAFLVMHYLRPAEFSQLSLHLANVGIVKGDIAFLFVSLVLERLPCLQIPAVCSSPPMSTFGRTRASSPPREDATPSTSTSRGRKSLRSEMPFGSDQSILENVVHNPKSRLPNYDDTVIMENTRYAQLIKYILNAKILCIVESQPSNIVTLMCDAFGVVSCCLSRPVTTSLLVTPRKFISHSMTFASNKVHYRKYASTSRSGDENAGHSVHRLEQSSQRTGTRRQNLSS